MSQAKSMQIAITRADGSVNVVPVKASQPVPQPSQRVAAQAVLAEVKQEHPLRVVQVRSHGVSAKDLMVTCINRQGATGRLQLKQVPRPNSDLSAAAKQSFVEERKQALGDVHHVRA